MSLLTGVRFATFVYFILVFDDEFIDTGKGKEAIVVCSWSSTVISVFMTLVRWSLKRKPTVAFGGGKPDYEVLF